MKPKLIIVGAGLGGCVLANALAEVCEVSIIEFGEDSALLKKRIKDIGMSPVTDPSIEYGLGGTTKVWHNGLIEIEEEVFDKKWPFKKFELSKYYEIAFHILSGVEKKNVTAASANLKQKFIDCGIPKKLMGETLYYPRKRLNVWHSLNLKDRVKLIEGEVIDFRINSNLIISKLVVKTADKEIEVGGDLFILAAGGLGSPLLLQKLAEQVQVPALAQAGLNYEDHPLGFVADFEFKKPLYKLWNLKVPKQTINMRLPLIVKKNGLYVSFQLRPAVHFSPRKRVYSVLNELRNKPFNFRSYLRVFTHLDDILDILSFKFGIHLPSRYYTLFMVAEQTPSSTCSIWRDKSNHQIYRKWEFQPDYLNSLHLSIHQLFKQLTGVKNINIFSDLALNIASSAHFSGTARMSESPNYGVCDKDGRVHGMNNLYVCDGSLIPSSGSANTGLTIAALALRMADHFKLNQPTEI